MITKMAAVLAAGLLTGCAHRELTHQFVRTDRSFTPAPRSEVPKVLVEAREIDAEPPLRVVGVLQVTGENRKSVDGFLAKIATAGAELGCDAVLQADVFELD